MSFRLSSALRSSPLLALRQTRAGSGPSYSPPTGFLFGEKPPAPGQKREKQDWENIYYYGMGGGMALAAVLLYYKPDTSIEGWARKEAEAKMAAAGETPAYTRS